MFSQQQTELTFEKDSIIVIESNPEKGFYSPYILFIPKDTPRNKSAYLLVEPNNTGRISDLMEVHLKSAIELASVSSVGNNIAKELKIPLLVPVFPRPESKPLVYTHALDSDVIIETIAELKRLDLQLIAMINDGRKVLEANEIITEEKIFMNGFSASATFTNRFLFLHPEVVEAAAMGGLNGKLMLPLASYNSIKLDYPLGINNFKELFGNDFNLKAYKSIPQYIYMGTLDDNDAVQFDDAYNDGERAIINSKFGKKVQERWQKYQGLYQNYKIDATFQTYEEVGHWTNSTVNLDVILFFYSRIMK